MKTILAALLSVVAVNAPASELEVGKSFPSLVLPALEDGRPLSVADFAGKKLAVHIWASW